jgi:hypothetical protein
MISFFLFSIMLVLSFIHNKVKSWLILFMSYDWLAFYQSQILAIFFSIPTFSYPMYKLVVVVWLFTIYILTFTSDLSSLIRFWMNFDTVVYGNMLWEKWLHTCHSIILQLLPPLNYLFHFIISDEIIDIIEIYENNNELNLIVSTQKEYTNQENIIILTLYINIDFIYLRLINKYLFHLFKTYE